MNQISKVLIAGAGAIGSMVAWEIEQSLPGTVSILATKERLTRYKKNGFIIRDTKYNFPLTDAQSSSNPDFVIVACKFHHLTSVIQDLQNHIGKNTLILSLLNGISSEEILGQAFGKEKLPYAMIIGTDAGHSGNKTNFSKTGIIYFGEAKNGDIHDASNPDAPAQGQVSQKIALIADFFDRAHIQYRIPADMLNRLWYKFMLNVGLNQVTAVLRQPYKILKTKSRIPEAQDIFENAMREVILIAQAENIHLSEKDFDSYYATIDALSDEGKTSMCQDVEAGRKTEVELFSGTIVALGKKHRIPTPVNDLLFKLLRSIEQSYGYV